MQTRFLIGLFIVLSFGILFVLVRSYREAMGSYSLPEFSAIDTKNKNEDSAKLAYLSNWVGKISKKSDIPFVYPATELQVKLSLAKEPPSDEKNVYQVKVGAISDYQFFCINQVLEAHRIQYSYYKIGENMWFSVTTKDEQYLKNVLEKLKHYEINYALSKS